MASNGQGKMNHPETDKRLQDNGQGKVLHPETDGRLKGNEANRPNDPDGSGRAEGGRKGGQQAEAAENHDGHNQNFFPPNAVGERSGGQRADREPD